jgi:hypothetical protein
MYQCRVCRATLATDATWCGQCFTPVATTPAPYVHAAPLVALPPSDRRSRWRGSQTTFGPLGRMVITVLLFLPVPFFVFAGMFWAGAFIYVFLLLPWGLRDVWRRTRVRAG